MEGRKPKKRQELLKEMAGYAVARHVRMSPRKVRVVANLVRGRAVDDALAILQNLPKRSAKVLAKIVKSAVANADDKSGGKVDVDSLVVRLVEIDGGTTWKRWLPRAMGRATRINKRTSHITVAVDSAA